jgi:hypothetical protein
MPDLVYQRADAVLCFENFKEAALYFNRVLPLNMGRMRGDPVVGDILVGFPEEVPSAALSHLVDGIEGNTKTYSHASRIMEFTAERWVEFARSAEPYARLWASRPGELDASETRSQYERLRSSYLSNEELPGHRPIRAIFHDYARSLGFQDTCVSVPAGRGAAAVSADPSLTLSQLRLVDATSADWRQIVELRKDKRSHQQLARLRLFMHSNYAGQPFAFIEDDLAKRIDDYEASARKHGLKTVLSSLTILLDAKDLQASVGAGLVAGLFGGPLLGIGAGLAVEVGKVAVHVAERFHDMRDWRSGHELAYIFETRAAIDGSSEA